jgi:hypothetical protein
MINDFLNMLSAVSQKCYFCGKRGGTHKGNLDNNSIYESNLDRYYHPQCLFDLLDNPQSNPKKVDTAIALADYANEHKDDEAKLSTQNAIKMERAKTKSEVVKSIFKDIK